MSRIAVIGLGSMGSRMAVNYVEAGHDVVVWNRSEQRARELSSHHDVEVARTVREAVGNADFVVSMVADDEAARSVWLDSDTGALAAMDAGAVAIESSTLTPGAVRQLEEAAKAQGVPFLEAPVVGSRPQAESGSLFVLLGGEQAVLERAMPIIEVNAGNTKHVGSVGNAAMMKLAINGLFAAQVAAYAEVVGFIERSDLDAKTAIATLAALPITSPGLERILGLIESRDFAPNFPVALVAKDVAYLSGTAGEINASMPLMTAVKDVYEDGASGPERDLDISGIASRYVD